MCMYVCIWQHAKCDCAHYHCEFWDTRVISFISHSYLTLLQGASWNWVERYWAELHGLGRPTFRRPQASSLGSRGNTRIILTHRVAICCDQKAMFGFIMLHSIPLWEDLHILIFHHLTSPRWQVDPRQLTGWHRSMFPSFAGLKLHRWRMKICDASQRHFHLQPPGEQTAYLHPQIEIQPLQTSRSSRHPGPRAWVPHQFTIVHQ